MTWMEIIKLRSATGKPLPLLEELKHQIDHYSRERVIPQNISFMLNRPNEYDLAVLLTWQSELVDEQGSKLASYLSSFLREFGAVNHTVWEELT